MTAVNYRDNHSIESAMRREELTEEEAYFILRFAGRVGYDRAIKKLCNPWKNVRQWFVWVGGWENTEIGQWDRGKKAWEIFARVGKKLRLREPYPISFFGHRITLFGRGHFSLKFMGGYLCASHEYSYAWPNKLYWSPNGTPDHKRAIFLLQSKKCAGD